jgi:hypothetical protein
MATKKFVKKGGATAISSGLASHNETKLMEAGRLNNFKHITVLPELESYIAPLSEEEFALLEDSIVSLGKVREKLLIWKKSGTEWVLIDGHHRYKVLQKHKELPIEFGVEEAYLEKGNKVASLDDAMALMEEIQLSRRNATRNYMSYLRGRAFLREKGERGGDRKSEDANNSGAKREIVAQRFKVGTRTIERDAEFAVGVDRFQEEGFSDERQRILLQESLLTKNDVQFIGRFSEVPVETTVQFLSNGGNLESLKDIPQPEWVEFMKSYKGADPAPVKPVQSKAPEKPSAKADAFFSWYKKEDKIIQKIAKKGDQEAIQQKLNELDERIQHLEQLRGILQS